MTDIERVKKLSWLEGGLLTSTVVSVGLMIYSYIAPTIYAGKPTSHVAQYMQIRGQLSDLDLAKIPENPQNSVLISSRNDYIRKLREEKIRLKEIYGEEIEDYEKRSNLRSRGENIWLISAILSFLGWKVSGIHREKAEK